MRLNQAARDVIGDGVNATLVTLSPKGNPQVSAVWVGLEVTPHGDELVTGHLKEHVKVRNMRRQSLVVVGIFDPNPDHWEGVVRPFLRLTGTATVEESNIVELERKLAKSVGNPEVEWPPAGYEHGYLTRIRIEKVGGMGPWDAGTGTRMTDIVHEA
ncbi:hypothetical protein EB74_33135 [Mycobacterium sp. SWH-M5]|nr:hypothetical protein EB74_33135 [Mycobacterium sp. SWH-M5]